MQCYNPQCNAILPDGARFCHECGTTAKSEAACRFCGVMNPLGSAFCLECGKSQAEPVGQKGSMTTVAPLDEYVYLLDQEKLRTESAKDVVVPYGCVGISMRNGQVQKVQLQKPYAGNKESTFKGWLKSLWEAAVGPAEQKVPDSQTYVLMDLRGLPVITHRHPTPIPGFQDASLRFEFWVDPYNNNNLGLFLQRCLGTRHSLSFNEVKVIAVENMTHLLTSFNLSALASDPASASGIGAELERVTGITAKCYFVKGAVAERRQIEVSKVQKPVRCTQCQAEYKTFTKFCEECGNSLSNVDWTSGVSYLQASGGEQLTLRLSMLLDASEDADKVTLDEVKVSEEIIKYLGPILRRYDVPSLMKSVMLTQLSSELNTRLMRDWRGHVTEFSVVDLRTAQEDWFFKTDALVAEELRKVETDKKFLAVDDSKLDLQEMAFALVMRKVRQEDSEELSLRRQALEARSKIVDVEVDLQALETGTELRKEAIEDEAHKQRLAREKDKMLRERDVAREMTSGENQDELAQVDHDITLEKKAAQHDIDLGDMTGEAESRSRRRGISDESFVEDEAIRLDMKRQEETDRLDMKRQEETDRLDIKRREEKVRLDAKANEQLGNIEEDLEDRRKKRKIEELRALAELEANMTAQEQTHELNKTKEENALARDKIDAMKNMDAVQMLAMQAAELAKVGGGGQASADMIKAIAESHSKTAASQAEASSGVKVAEAQAAAAAAAVAMQEKLYERMLNIQKESSESAVEAHKSAAALAQSTNEKSMESMMQVAKVSAAESNQGYKEAAKISQSVNEKSMDSMAKVATAAAGKKTAGKDDSDTAKFECRACGAVAADSKVPKFCGQCGAKPTVD